jgi:hypothetical protein
VLTFLPYVWQLDPGHTYDEHLVFPLKPGVTDSLCSNGLFHLVFELVLLNIHEICLKLKSGFRIIHKSPTFQKPLSFVYSILAMAGPSDVMKPERFGSGKNFHHWQNKVKFGLCQWGCGGLSTPWCHWWFLRPLPIQLHVTLHSVAS